MLESQFQYHLKAELEARFPSCVIIKQDPNHLQGVPDLLVLWRDRWAMLETKRSRNAELRPNQEYYVQLFDDMSFSAFINPENYLEVLHDMERAFR